MLDIVLNDVIIQGHQICSVNSLGNKQHSFLIEFNDLLVVLVLIVKHSIVNIALRRVFFFFYFDLKLRFYY